MKMILRKNPFPFRGGSLENEFSWNVSVSDQKKFRQYRTKIVRQMRRQIFRQMKQKAE